jgi:hypothetical protein
VLGPEEMEIDKVDTFTSAGPSVRESSLVAVHEFKVHSTVRLVPFLTASALQCQGTSTSASAYHNDGFASGPPHESPPTPVAH